MIEQLRDGIQIVAIVLVEGIHHSHIMILQFHKQQGYAIYESHDVGPATIEGTMHLQLPHAKELILVRRSKVYHLGAYLFRLAIRFGASHWYAITNQLILLLVDLHQRLTAHVLRQALYTLLQLLIRQPGVQSL